jgi:hypothetical protein
MEAIMQRKRFFCLAFVVVVLLTIDQVMSQIPSLEEIRVLPSSVSGSTSAASDGYGQHVVRVFNSEVQHVLLDNNGGELSQYTSVVGNGQEAVVATYPGKLRVLVKSGLQQVSLYQSDNGGTLWTLLTGQPFNAPVSVYDIDAFTDNWGTHFVWATGQNGSDEVYYLRYDENAHDYTGLKNVTGLPAQQNGYRPKISNSTSEAHVQFIAPNQQMYSRDLDLGTGNWDNNYVVLSNLASASSVSSTTVLTTGANKIFCLIAQEPSQASPQPQNFYLVDRLSSDQSWSTPQYVTTTTSGIGGGYMRNTIVASPTKAVTRFDSTIEMHALLNEP